jgi:two-component system sensor histidine kinase TorS
MTRRTILLVDDSIVIQLTVSALLEDHGHDVVIAGSVAEARDLFDQTFDAALIDLHLPDGSGVQLLAELRARRPETVRILMTGDTSAATAEGAAHAELVLEKGGDPTLIGTLIDRAIDERRAGAAASRPPHAAR